MQELYPYLLEEQVHIQFSIAKLVLIIIMVISSISFLKQFFYKNILLINTITGDKKSSITPTPIYNLNQDIYSQVINAIPTPQTIIQTVIVKEEIIKYIEVTPTPITNTFKGKYSWYYPPLGGINCDRNSDGTEECTYLANGEIWQNWYERGAACPLEWSLGQKIRIIELGLDLTCVDRGGAIIKDDQGFYWIDHLTNSPRLYWSSPITIQLLP